MSIGSAVIDRILDGVDRLDAVGGAALNVAVGAQRLGIATSLIAVVQDDDAGRTIRSFLEREGVALARSAHTTRPTAVVESRRDGDGIEYRFSSDDPSGLLQLVDEHFAFVNQGHTVALSAARFADDAGRVAALLDDAPGRVLYDPNPRRRGGDDALAHRREIETLAPVMDLVKLSADDADLLWGCSLDDATAEILGLGARAVLATHGAGGASITTSAGSTYASSQLSASEVVDPMGAGDATLAAIGASIVRDGWPAATSEWTDRLHFAMAVAAYTCLHSGGATSMPRAEQVNHAGARL
ncbi:carbohydrate kinase family protein [Microbacterium sp. NPDC058389]|uniref:carbohydrate kinase family protein n=1 Tax=Microbacterium sp. NPDC058389 TaxID=3346475 RepID=UPI0036605D79